MDLIDKEDARNKLCNTLVNISINDFVDLPSKFISDFCSIHSIRQILFVGKYKENCVA